MTNKHEALADLIRAGQLQRLFIEELGWDRPAFAEIEGDLDGEIYRFQPLAEKQGFAVLRCEQGIPDHPTRQRLHRIVSRRAAEHFVIYVAKDGSQFWQWTELRAGRPARLVAHEWHPGRENYALVERLVAIGFELAEEGSLNLLGVRRRVGAAFSADKVSSRFYKDFQDEHKHLLKQIKGIDLPEELEWYASVLLNRLMFLYFVQKKGYLDGDHDYLRNRFERVRDARGPGHFFTFFQRFLIPLFHDALARKEPALDDADLAELVGDVPYVNGGFFSVHELEKKWSIDVSDEAFSRVFVLFDSYRWHLTESPGQDERAINPDVLGYVFERYINQKEKGAYYTKTDVTRFMVRSALVPVFLDRWEDRARSKGLSGPRWGLIEEEPDRYLPAGLAHGASRELPGDIGRAGDDWPTPAAALDKAPETHGLPAETWLETIDRRRRLDALRAQLGAGEITDASAAITSNLAIITFAIDAIRDLADPESALLVLDVLQDLRVVDPACGSGAFLFAALNVLEELYEAAIETVRSLPGTGETEERRTARIAEIDAHASVEYFIAKSAALHNLFGVDIMHEAVEIAKLRLFLKLVAGLSERSQLEPLPDLDLNLRAGNTVVGFLDAEEAERAAGASILAGNRVAEIETACGDLSDRYEAFVSTQTASDVDDERLAEAKDALLLAEGAVANTLDDTLAAERGVQDRERDEWWERERPFHWFVEFGSVMRRGGFDCVVGNPPYRKISEVRSEYTVEGFATDDCPDLYAPMTERASQLLAPGGRMAFIVPLSLTFSEDFTDLRRYLTGRFPLKWISSYARNPTALFDGKIGVRPTIFVGADGEESRLWSTRTHRWSEEYRPSLFDTLHYVEVPPELGEDEWPKLASEGVAELMMALRTSGRKTLATAVRRGGEHRLGYKKTALYVLSAYRSEPPCWDENGKLIPQKKAGWLAFDSALHRDVAFLLATGKLMFLWWNTWGDDFDVTADILDTFPLGLDTLTEEFAAEATELAQQLDEAMQKHIDITSYAGMRIGNYRLDEVRDITDEADQLLSRALDIEAFMPAVELSFRFFAKKTGERPGTTALEE
ncbi:MAG: DNA methyltransferase [Solirubrobacteraceae bacterium]